jgi:hypothetical protein
MSKNGKQWDLKYLNCSGPVDSGQPEDASEPVRPMEVMVRLCEIFLFSFLTLTSDVHAFETYVNNTPVP